MKMKKITVFFIIAATITIAAVVYLKHYIATSNAQNEHGMNISVEAITGVAIIEDKNLKTWSLIDHDTKLTIGSIVSTYGKNSGLMLRLKKDRLLALDSNSSVKVTESVDLLYGCFGIKDDDKDFAFKCSDGRTYFKPISTSTTVNNGIIKSVPVSPCGEIFEDNIVTLSSSGLKSDLKLFQVATDLSFANIVFETRTYWNSIKTSTLKDGKYYWRLNNGRACNFEVIKGSLLKVVEPKNQEAASDGSIEFEWETKDKMSKYTFIVFSSNSGTVQTASVVGGRYVIDDPLQTLGPGSYFWYIKDDEGRASTPRSFYVMTGRDIVLENPTKDLVLGVDQKFIPVIWSPVQGAKNYGVAISSSPSFMNMDYANTTDEPFVFVPVLAPGSYFIKISALFDNSKKIATDAIPFSVKKAD